MSSILVVVETVYIDFGAGSMDPFSLYFHILV